jgi:hypothetical protein
MVLRKWLVVLLGLGAPALVTGCGPESATVSGTVLVDGEPVDKGVIVYVPADRTGAPVSGEIQKGRYEVRATPGKKRVQISAPAVVGKRKEYNGPTAPLVEITKERVPARYSGTGTELTFDVQSGGNTKDWAIETKARKR